MTGSPGWKYRARHEIRKEAAKEFSGWNSNQFIDEILSLREELSNANKELRKLMEEKETSSKQAEFNEKKFKMEWSNPTKIAFLLFKQQKPMTSLEIEKALREHDRGFKDYNNPTLILSTTLARMTKSGRIKRVKLPGIRTYFFALPQWFNKEGDLREDFQLELRSFE